MSSPRPAFAGADVLDHAKTVLLYGAGRVGRDVARVIQGAGHDVRAFLDRAASPGQAVDGVPVFRPDDNPLSRAERGLPVVVSIFNRDVDVEAVATGLAALGHETVVSFVELHARHAAALGDRFWLTGRAVYGREEQTIEEAKGLLSDEASQHLFADLVRFRATGDYGVLPRPTPLVAPYVPSDVPGWPPAGPLRAADCGAYDGDSLAGWLEAGIDLEAVAAFEPDVASFRRLVARVRTFPNGIRATASLYPCAVSDETGLARLEGEGEWSELTEKGDRLVAAVALDDALAGFRPTFVKLDVEGAEEKALLGLRRLAADLRPALAVCVYHRPAHLWDIPRLLASWGLGYRLFLRTHGFDGFDTVVYAVGETA